MSRTLNVELNHGSPHALEARPTPFETDGAFAVELDNRGAASHVHLRVDEALAAAASVTEHNRFVDGGETETVPVRVERGASDVAGVLEIVTGYGAERLAVPVRVVAADPRSVDVDESLAEVHAADDPSRSARVEPAVPGAVAFLGLVCTALAVAFAGAAVGAAVGAIAVACAVGAWYALR